MTQNNWAGSLFTANATESSIYKISGAGFEECAEKANCIRC